MSTDNAPPEDAPESPRSFTHDDPDVRTLVTTMAGMMGDACPDVHRLAGRLRWDVARLLMAVGIARADGHVQTWVDPDGNASLALSPGTAAMHGLELVPEESAGIPDRRAWRPLGTRPGKIRMKARKFEVRASELSRKDPVTFLSIFADHAGREDRIPRSAIFGLADDHGLAPEPTQLRAEDRVILSPLPAWAFAIDLLIEWESGRLTKDEFVGLMRPHLQPVGLSHAWTPRNEDRAPGEHRLDRGGDPRLAFTIDSPRFWRFNKYGPRRKAEEFARAKARELARQEELEKCPGCRDRDLGPIEYCMCCCRSGLDALLRHDDAHPKEPNEAGIAEKDRIDTEYSTALRRLRRACLPWPEREALEEQREARRMAREEKLEERRKAKEERLAARMKARDEKAALERSRTRTKRGRPPGGNMSGGPTDQS